MELSKEVVAQYFNLPVKQAANKLNVGLTVLKRRCRQLGFKRWPHRRLMSLDLLISTLQAENGGATVDNYTKVIIARLKEERRRVEENPDYKLASSTIKLRQQISKARYERMKNLNLDPATATEVTPLDVIHPTNNSGFEQMDGAYDCNNERLE
ncbi:hypothetical protein CTI12_AA087800 [Artemisia annua]|uniref:RWP-RK domain-containing protein n=1 Tax=Artemisia annua TaxID=35608 RepID=A0A2U1Q0T6_ARTAN|nr:hypothetical protein CTI12_AA087800 [Artemisia annua]